MRITHARSQDTPSEALVLGGCRRHWGLVIEGSLKRRLWVVVTPGDAEDADIVDILHRVSAFERCGGGVL